MEQRHTTLRQAGRAALYAVFKGRHRRNRRLFLAFESFSIVVVFVLTIILQTYLQINPPTYALDPAVKKLVGESRDDAATYLKDDVQTKAFAFSVPKNEDSGDASVHTGRVADAYEASLAKDAREGITVTEKESQIAVGLTPTFKTYEGRKVEGDHVVYLAQGGVKLVYTLKYNGLKEDIIVPSYRGDKLEYGFELSLPAGTEARLDGSGNIGIYSSDPTLFGNVSFGSDDDRARVEKARENGEKNHLVMTIPYPIVKDASGTEYTDKAKFSLGAKQTKTSQAAADPKLPAEVQEKMKASTTKNVYSLTIASQGLKNLSYPLSIDPTVTVTSASDFAGLNNEGGVEVDTTNSLIRRSGLTGGVLNAWTNTTPNYPNPREGHGQVAYNGYIYMIAGHNETGGHKSDVQYARLQTDGTLASDSGCGSSWCATTSLSQVRVSAGAVAYNNYMYVLGGLYFSGSTQYLNDVQRAPIKADGTLGSWSAMNSFTGARASLGVAVYNNYIYITGGNNSQGTSVQYAPINGDGSIGTWVAGASLPANRESMFTETYNNKLYVAGGITFGVYYNSVLTIDIKADGSLGSSWQTHTNTFATGRGSLAGFIANGYVYIAGGCSSINANGACIGFMSDVQYAQINADGTVGTWRTTASLTNARDHTKGSFYGGYLYSGGGCTANNTLTGACTAYNGAVQYTQIKPAGWVETWTQQTNQYTSGRQHFGAVAYNGYLYISGGCNSNCFNAGQVSLNDTQYAPINTDGSIGTWTTAPATGYGGAGRAAIAMTAHNGYLYVHGGFSIDAIGVHTNYSTLFYSAINHATGAPGAWQTATNSPGTRAEHVILGYNGYLYSFGGRNNQNMINTVNYGAIDAGTGNITAAFQTTSNLPVLNARTDVAEVGGKFYMFGGCSSITGSGSYVCSGQHDEIFYTTINSDGTVGAWTTQTDGLNGARYDFGKATFVNGYFYIWGGDGPGQSTVVKYAVLNSDNSVGSWVSTASTLAIRTDPQTVAYGGHFYVVGGSVSRTIDRIPIHNGGDGNVSTWTEDAAPYAGGRRYHQVIAYNGYIYTMGGCFQNDCAISGAQTGGVEYAPLNADGSVGAWGNTSGFAARDSFGAIALNGYMYVTDGSYRTGIFNTLTQHNEMLYAQINSNGTLGTFNTTTNQTSAILFSNNVDTLYKDVGGSIYYTKPAANGTISSWTLASHTFIAATYHAGYVVHKNYLYRIGGCSSGFNCDATNTRRDVEFAPVDQTTGNTTAAFKLTSPLSLRRYVAGDKAFALNGYIILPPDGGPDGIGGLSFAPILPGGELGSWIKGRAMPVYYPSNAYALYNGVLYVNGGVNGNVPMGYTHYASLQSVPKIGSFSKLYDFGAGVKPTKLITRGTKQTSSKVKIDYSNSILCGAPALDQPQTIANTGYAAANAQTLTMGTSRTLARCLSLRYTIDEQTSSIFPDSGNETTISDFDLYFIANPGQRLRGGRTFTNGLDRGLDAQPQ